MIVYAIPITCHTCLKQFDALSYIQFAKFYGDVNFPYELWKMCEVYAELHPDNPNFDATYAKDHLCYPVHILGYNDELDQKMLSSSRIKGVKVLHSRQRAKNYPMNICPHCGAPHGGYNLSAVITDQYLYPNKAPKIFCVM